MYASIFPTKLGWMGVAADEKGISHVLLPAKEKKDVKNRLQLVTGGKIRPTDELLELESDLAAYFQGDNVNFKRHKLNPHIKSKFQSRVWSITKDIPYGRTMTYAQVAEKIGSPKACRAVGGALNSNPIPVLIPCHRIISSCGLGGFSSGIYLKKKMLELEGAL